MIKAYLAISSIIGIVASYIASKIFLYNKKHKPNILITDKFITPQVKDGIKSLKIKLINKIPQDLNIYITINGLKKRSPEGSIPLISLKHIAKLELINS